MIYYFCHESDETYLGVQSPKSLDQRDLAKLSWLFSGKQHCGGNIAGWFLGPRREMVTPWSTNACEIAVNMGILGILRIESLVKVASNDIGFDPMLQQLYHNPGADIFDVHTKPEPIRFIDDIAAYNQQQGLALSKDEIDYLYRLSRELGRDLTDSEIFGFSQVNSEHCRHKIFNGLFIIDGQKMTHSLFSLIKETSSKNPNRIVSAYKDNVAFVAGPRITQFAPERHDGPSSFQEKTIETVLSLKAETHNFPTTVEPFYGASTGSGGEIRDRMAGGQSSIPLAGTAVYMTSYPRLRAKSLPASKIAPRTWLYQSPLQILIKASNGASDFGNKFGQPLIAGSLLTFEHQEQEQLYGYDKVIMLAGGIGYAKKSQAHKKEPKTGDQIALMGGDNYRIGMGGSAVSSLTTGQLDSRLELNAVQRANPEMQKRVFNAIRALSEMEENPIISIHDHGAGGHLNCFSELVADSGGSIDIAALPLGDSTLSDKEIIGNESQERMGLVIAKQSWPILQAAGDRERSPIYAVGQITDDSKFTFVNNQGDKPIDLSLASLFGHPPKTIIRDESIDIKYTQPILDDHKIEDYLRGVLQLESVACKDWLVNKVDRSVTGLVAKQQCCGPLQLPLNNLGVMALDFSGCRGMATAIGHAPIASLADAAIGAKLAVMEALTNIAFAPLEAGLSGVSLSANWMWPCKNKGEDSRLYSAVRALSEFALELGINVPTGKDSLSMTQQYPDGKKVLSPGTVIVSAVGEISDKNKVVETCLVPLEGSRLYYIDLAALGFNLGGSALYQSLGFVGSNVVQVAECSYVRKAFAAIQDLLYQRLILAGHDISSGGLISSLLEMCFPQTEMGLNVELAGLYSLASRDLLSILFCEKPSIILQINPLNEKMVSDILNRAGVCFYRIGDVTRSPYVTIKDIDLKLDISDMRDVWFETSYLLEKEQSHPIQAKLRQKNYSNQPLNFCFIKRDQEQSSVKSKHGIEIAKETEKPKAKAKIKAAIIREKGINGDREMAHAMYQAGFDVQDIHMTDLVNNYADLGNYQFIVFPGGFSNSDVLGSAKGWAGVFRYNDRLMTNLKHFYQREDTLSLGVCNGCQLMVELDLIYPDHSPKVKMLSNDSGKFESAFISVEVMPNASVMLSSLVGSRLGIWVAHGEGKFQLPLTEEQYHIPIKYAYAEYPGNPNGSNYNAAALCSADGRHLAMMPHLERAVFGWQWAYQPRSDNAISTEIFSASLTPWHQAFVNARLWLEKI